MYVTILGVSVVAAVYGLFCLAASFMGEAIEGAAF